VPTEPVETIQTPRLELVSMSVAFMRALQARDLETADREAGALVPPEFPEHLDDFIRYRLSQLEADPSIRQWLGRVMVLTDESGTRRVVGSIGFHGPPDEAGRLEVGYRVEAPYRRRGYAREAVQAMFDWAASAHGIRRFIASISPTNEPSLRLAAGFRFVQTGSHIDEIDGLELVFEADWPTARAAGSAGTRSTGGRGSAARPRGGCG
jgi:ribosomal-protein-alanine N-acetyltransferase